jgi:hypothetical protein
MTPERANAYGRVMRTLADLGPAKLQRHEQDVIREAADAMFFAHDLDGDEHAAAAMSELGLLAARLVASDRWLFETADRLVHDVEHCGPAAIPARELALA